MNDHRERPAFAGREASSFVVSNASPALNHPEHWRESSAVSPSESGRLAFTDPGACPEARNERKQMAESRAKAVGGTLLVIGVIVLAAIIGPSACTDNATAQRVLTEQGYTNIELTGYRWWGGSKDDTFKTGFVATSPAGRRVSGIVCNGWMKGATIRFD